MALSLLQPNRSPGSLARGEPASAPYAPTALAERLVGRLCEIARPKSGGQSSLASALVASAQRRRQAVAWLQPRGGGLYAPDLAAAGVDVAALAVLHVGAPSEPALRLRAAEWLLTGGGFGLVVIDLNEGAPTGLAWQGRLLQLAREHHSTVVLLTGTGAEAPSLGALVSLRLWPERASEPELEPEPNAAAAAPATLSQITVQHLAPRPGPSAALGSPGPSTFCLRSAGPTEAFDLQVAVLKNKAAPLPGFLSLPCCGPLELQG